MSNLTFLGPKNLSFYDSDFKNEVQLIYAWLYQKNPKTTKRAYEFILKSFYEQFPGISFKAVTASHLVQFLEHQKDKSLATRRLYKNCLSSLLGYMERAEFLKNNPSKLLDRISYQDKTDQKIISKSQLKILITLESNPRNQLIIQLLYLTGMRVSEFQQLRWSDFVDREDRWQLTVIGKGKRVRSIYISKKNEFSKLFLVNNNSYVSGERLSSTHIYRIVRQAGERVGLKKFSPHWLRHCHATHSLEAGAPIHIVQETLGHSSLETTGKYLSVINRTSSCDWISPTENSSEVC